MMDSIILYNTSPPVNNIRWTVSYRYTNEKQTQTAKLCINLNDSEVFPPENGNIIINGHW